MKEMHASFQNTYIGDKREKLLQLSMPVTLKKQGSHIAFAGYTLISQTSASVQANLFHEHTPANAAEKSCVHIAFVV